MKLEQVQRGARIRGLAAEGIAVRSFEEGVPQRKGEP